MSKCSWKMVPMTLLDMKILMDRGAWRAAVHGVTKSQTWLSSWTAAGCVVASFPCSTVLDILASHCFQIASEFYLLLLYFCSFFLKDSFGLEACGILIPKPGIEPAAPALEGKTSREAPKSEFYKLPSACVVDCFLFPHCRRPLKHLFLFPVSALYIFCPLFLHICYSCHFASRVSPLGFSLSSQALTWKLPLHASWPRSNFISSANPFLGGLPSISLQAELSSQSILKRPPLWHLSSRNHNYDLPIFSPYRAMSFPRELGRSKKISLYSTPCWSVIDVQCEQMSQLS